MGARLSRLRGREQVVEIGRVSHLGVSHQRSLDVGLARRARRDGAADEAGEQDHRHGVGQRLDGLDRHLADAGDLGALQADRQRLEEAEQQAGRERRPGPATWRKMRAASAMKPLPAVMPGMKPAERAVPI